MKIAICGTNTENNQDFVVKFITTYRNYISPGKNVFSDIKWEDETFIENLTDIVKDMSEMEKELYYRMQLVYEQSKKLQDKGFIIFNGCSIDVLASTLGLSEYTNNISDEFIEKMIYWNKKLLKDIDLIFWMPDENIWKDENGEAVDEIEETSLEDTVEMCYNNIYLNYKDSFDSSPLFDQENCPAIFVFETDSPMSEIQVLLNSKGNMNDDDDLQDVNRMQKLLGNNTTLLNGLKEGLDKGLGSSCSFDL